MEVEDRSWSGGIAGQPPTGELVDARFGRGEFDRLEGNSEARGSSPDLRRWMIEKLPVALPEEQAERKPAADGGSKDRECDAADQPADGDVGIRAARLLPEFQERFFEC